MPYMYSEMQNKLSKTRESPLESMGQIISSRCPIGVTFTRVRYPDESVENACMTRTVIDL